MHKEGKEPTESARSYHRIHVAINNRQAEHQDILVESSGKIKNAKLKILLDYEATDSFIYAYALDKCGLVACKQNDFRLVEMASE